MSDLKNKNEEVKVEKKKPYNIREKKQKEAAYRSLIRAELADELYDKILNIIVVQKKYKDPDYSAKELAKELNTNTRYLSAVVNSRFGMNYSCLLNEYRVKDAAHYLADKRYEDKNVEEISDIYLRGLRFHYVKTVMDVFSIAITQEKSIDAISL